MPEAATGQVPREESASPGSGCNRTGTKGGGRPGIVYSISLSRRGCDRTSTQGGGRPGILCSISLSRLGCDRTGTKGRVILVSCVPFGN